MVILINVWFIPRTWFLTFRCKHKTLYFAGKFDGKSIYFYDTSMINAYFEDYLSEEEKDLLNYYLLSLATLQILNGKLSKDVLNQDFVDYDICTVTVVE